MVRLIKIGASVVLLFFLLAGSISAADWPTFRGNSEHSGVSTETLAVPLDKKWEYDIGGSEYSSPIVAGGRVFVGSSNWKIYAINATSGAWIWEYQTEGPIEAAPLYNNNTIYIGSADGYLYALDATNGSFLWSFNAGSAITSSVVTDGTNIYFAAQSGDIFAVNLTSHNPAWVSPYNVPGGFSYPSPALVLSKQYNALFIGSEEGVVYAINTTGTTKWTYTATGNNFVASSPAVVGGVVYIGSNNGTVYAITASNGALDWSYQAGSSDIFGSPAVTSNTVYLGDNIGNVYAIGTTASTKGKLKWSYRGGNQIKSSPVVSGNLVFIGSTNLFYALDATTGDFRWSYGVGQGVASPAIANGWLYLVSDKLYAFQPTPISVAMIEKWRYDTGSTISMSGLAVDGSGVAYVGADNGTLYAINTNGTIKWTYPTNGGMISSAPVVSGGVVYFSNRHGKTFFAVNATDGSLKWSKPIDGQNAFVSSTPVVFNNVVYYGSRSGYFYAKNISDGSDVWMPYSIGTSQYNLSSPIIDSANNRIYFAYGNKNLVALNLTTGAWVWESPLNGNNSSDRASSILLVNNILYAGGYDWIHAIDLNGVKQWEYNASGAGALDVGFVEWQGILIGVGGNGKIVALDTTTHTLKWTPYTINGIPGLPFKWQDVVFVMTTGYRVYGLNMEDGRLRFEYAGNFSPLSPVVTGVTGSGILYLGSRDGRIYAEDIDHYSIPVQRVTGGTILTVYGDRLEIPANSLPADTTVTITVAQNDQGGVGITALPRKYSFGPNGTTFSPPVTAKFAYKNSDLGRKNPSEVKVYVWDSTTSIWTAQGGTVDTNLQTIGASLNHFSDYALFGSDAPELNFPVFAPEYIYGTKVTIPFSAVEGSGISNVRAWLNDVSINNGDQITLTKLGANIFKIEGVRNNNDKVVQTITFNVKYALEWLSPVTNQPVSYGSTLPIKFRAKDYLGNFVEDQSIQVEITDGVGNNVAGPFSSAKGNVYIKISESHYLINFDTSKYSWITPGGTYQIKVGFNGISYPPYSFTVVQ